MTQCFDDPLPAKPIMRLLEFSLKQYEISKRDQFKLSPALQLSLKKILSRDRDSSVVQSNQDLAVERLSLVGNSSFVSKMVSMYEKRRANKITVDLTDSSPKNLNAENSLNSEPKIIQTPQ